MIEEWKLLITICRDFAKAGYGDYLPLVQGSDFQWGRFLMLCIDNGLLSVAAHQLIKSPGFDIRSQEWSLVETLHYQQLATLESRRAQGRHMHIIRDTLESLSMPYAFRKGASYDNLLYRNRGLRRSGDIDVLIRPQDAQDVMQALIKLGFQPGVHYSFTDEGLFGIPRKEALIYKLSPDHLPHAIKLSDEPWMPYFDVDIAMSLTWYGSPYELATDSALRNPLLIELDESGTLFPVLSAPYQILDCALHLFRESYFLRFSHQDKLSKFFDLYLFLATQASTWDDVVSLVKLNHLEKPMAWVLHYLDQLFETSFFRQFDSRMEQGLSRVDEDFFKTVIGTDGQPRVWTGQFKERLLCRRSK